MSANKDQETFLGRLNNATPEDWDKATLMGVGHVGFGTNRSDKFVPLCPTPEGTVASSMAAPELPSRDQQVGGSHYKDSEHQPLEIVLHTEGYEAFRGACLVKIYKYLQRKKVNRTEDYKKAQHILNWLVEESENEEATS